MMVRRGLVAASAAAVVWLVGGQGANAAEDETAPAASKATTDRRQIEEVVVTAERRESTVSDTSISITAFTAETLENFGIRNQSDLQNLVPATTIQPYDSTIRGVGRNFRNLGGDPGVSTYMNEVYSEDLYTATIGSFWDIERIEVLRGPQGTLYGRNAVGGAMNFLYKKPTDEFEASIKTVLGNYGTADVYGVVSGPLIENVLSARLTGSSREHDGWVEERGIGSDLDNGDETNVALQFEWQINDQNTFNIRANQADVDRVFGGGDGGGLIVLAGENSVLPPGSPGADSLRNYTVQSHGVRAVDPTVTDPLSSAFVDASSPIYTYTNPTTGAPIQAQRIRPGVDPSTGGRPNYGRDVTRSTSECVFLDRDNIEGKDLCAFTNGYNNETFDQTGVQAEYNLEISDSVQLKYIFGYNDLTYERITENDSTASVTDDSQFYVNHEATYVSNELQLFWDLGDSLSFTSGLFYYDATIDQRYDFYSSTCAPQFCDPTWALDNILATVAPGAVPGDPPLTFLQGNPSLIDVNSARDAAIASGAAVGEFTVVTGPWLGDASLTGVPNGPAYTPGSDLLETNKTKREAYAVYTQGVWDINALFTLTVGARYANDDLEGEENLAQYAEESTDIFGALGLNLALANIIRGAINPLTLQPTGAVEPWLAGVPIQFGAYRNVERDDDKVTWRVNLDYNVAEHHMVYANVTTGYRAGGFNLAFFSQTPTYEPEELIAYELGYKARFLDNSLEFTAATYFYDYESIHTFTEEACPPGGTVQSAQSACAVVDSTASVQAAPGAEMTGFEIEGTWLATDNLTLGGNFSYTDSEFTKSFFVVDGADPSTPGAIYNANNNPDRRIDVKGNQLPQVPEMKSTLYALYLFQLGDSGTLDLFSSWSYIDDVYFGSFERELDKAPSYQRIDVRGSWRSPEERWIVSGFVNNVTDEIGIRQIIRHGDTDGYRRTAQVSEPRVYGVELTYNLR
jgi:iron complex outermembrane receptor protein